jgi:hypothetical protein
MKSMAWCFHFASTASFELGIFPSFSADMWKVVFMKNGVHRGCARFLLPGRQGSGAVVFFQPHQLTTKFQLERYPSLISLSCDLNRCAIFVAWLKKPLKF